MVNNRLNRLIDLIVFTLGKSFDTFCPVGPVIATAAAVGDPNKLAIKCRLNGKTMQASKQSGA